MADYIVKCPYCNTPKKVSQNMGYKCSVCNANITIGNDGKVRRSSPGKLK